MLFKPAVLAILFDTMAVLAGSWESSSRDHLKYTGTRPELVFSPKQPFRPFPSSPPRNRICYVPSHNDSVTDDSPYILDAINKCNPGGHVVFSQGTKYTIGTALDLTNLTHVDLDIQGYIQFTNDTTYWQLHAFPQIYQNATTFFQLGGHDINVYGGGTLDGNGQAWYDLYSTNIYILRPVLFGTIGLHSGRIQDLNLRYSPQYYNFVANSSDLVFSNISISGYSKNPNVTAKNTDGWDTYRSSNIVIQDSIVNNGDDCISFKPNSTEILVQNLICNGSHGISVGSLGQYVGETDIVENIYVYNITMTNASDMARIKVWPNASTALSGDLQGGGGTGRVSNITYDTMYISNVDYAVEITQCYGQSNLTLCAEFPSPLTIENVTVRNLMGSTSGKYAPYTGYVVCSSESVCSGIVVEDVKVTSGGGNGTVDLFKCGNVDETLLEGIECVDVVL